VDLKNDGSLSVGIQVRCSRWITRSSWVKVCRLQGADARQSAKSEPARPQDLRAAEGTAGAVGAIDCIKYLLSAIKGYHGREKSKSGRGEPPSFSTVRRNPATAWPCPIPVEPRFGQASSARHHTSLYDQPAHTPECSPPYTHPRMLRNPGNPAAFMPP